MKQLKDALFKYLSWIERPIAPQSLGLFRCWFGIICLANLVLVWPDMLMWFSNKGVIPEFIHQTMTGSFQISLFWLFGRSDEVVDWIRYLGLIGGIGLVLGVFTRTSALMMWLAVVSMGWRNPLILHSGDNLIRIGLFFLIFARSDEAFSLSRWIRIKRGLCDPNVYNLIPAWPVRVLQLQLCIVYLVTAFWKSRGSAWTDGLAVGIVLQLGEFQRFWIPDFMATELASKLLSWFTLLIEFGFPILVWIPKLRIPVLIAGLALHVGLEWVMNVQLFQWTITSFYILFLTPSLEGLSRFMTRFKLADAAQPVGSQFAIPRCSVDSDPLQKSFKMLLVIVLVLPLLHIFRQSVSIDGTRYFVLNDDVMISMRYAKNLSDGFGLVWNRGGDAVEGFSNLLWTLYLSLVHILPLSTAKTSLLVAATNALVAMFLLIGIKNICEKVLVGRASERLLSCVLLAFYWPLMEWMAEGFEVGLIALYLIILWQIYLSEKSQAVKQHLASVILSFALLTRYDAVPPLLIFVWFGLSENGSFRALLRLTGLPLLVLVALSFWRLGYYGDILPNTYYLKLTGIPLLQRLELGFLQVSKSIWTHLWLLIFLAVFGAKYFPKRESRLILMPLATALIYSIWIGGDTWEREWMANRMVAAVLPPVFILISVGATNLISRVWKQGSAAAAFAYVWLVLFSFAPGFAAWATKDFHGNDLHRKVRSGLALKKLATGDDKIAVTWAGALPYFSDLDSIDILGKSDRYVARLEPKRLLPSGHTKWDLQHSIFEAQPRFIDELFEPSAEDLELLKSWDYRLNRLGIYEIDRKDGAFLEETGS